MAAQVSDAGAAEDPAGAFELDPDGVAMINPHDDWKDYSCSTPWEYFVNDLENAMRELQEAAGPSTRTPSLERALARREITYRGRTYILRMLCLEDDNEEVTP